ncbi:high choriolytic enzyme 2-like [Mizuhopecten yessoensis]|uniref:Metalloendopeptidase n=1 Tax=Mizuhopecten yessoensis TaxID=6573 RepID=A0A210QKC8_MIZYE|nr:high choriolytic enzyme 2-like [Mizuhopecten yessoensis]OWF49202.1 High choriolytic enzyme 1 [Mizuhopecten yessoensis]
MNAACLVLCLCVGYTTAVPLDLNNQIEVSEFVLPEEDYEVPDTEFTENTQDWAVGDKRNAINTNTYHTALWTGGVVPYVISSSYPASIRQTYEAAMREIEEDTKVHGKTCVHFVPRTSQSDYIQISPETGCHSPVGHHRGRGDVSLGHGCESKGTAMHEFLHVLGFFHEHERYDRDQYVTIHLENVITHNQKDYTKETTQQMNTLGVSYDYGSIMHYGAYAFAADKSKPTMVPKSHSAVIGQRLALSRKDVQKIQLLYNCGVDLSHIAEPSLPHKIINCDFETTCSHLHQDTTDTFNWVQHSGATHTHGTGPNADHTNSAGKYYLAQARHHHNKVARLITDTLPSGQTCISFSYFIYGSGVKEFSMKAEGTGIDYTFKRFPGSQVNQWTTQFITLTVPRSFKLVLQASIGNSDLGDIAIDDLSVYTGACVHP